MPSSDLKQGGDISRIAFIVILAVGITEVVVGSLAVTVALLADGIHSVATSIIFLIIWIGLRLSGRSPDGTFHFGYYRVQALGSLIAAFILSAFGVFILFEAYSAWVQQRVVVHPGAAIVVASVAAVIIVPISWQIEKASGKYGSTALEVGGLTGVIDVLSSISVAVGVALNSYFGILHADSIAGILIAAAIFVGAYSIFKEASLVLVDACRCGDVVNAVGEIAKSVKGIKEVHSIRIRKLGPYMTGDMHVVVSSDMLVREADQLATQVEKLIKEEFESVIDMKVRIESDEAHYRHTRNLEVRSDETNTENSG